MKFFFAIFVWLLMAAILFGGVLAAVLKGSFLLLILGVAAFVFAIAKIGCLSH